MRQVRGILTALSENYEIAYYRSVKNPLQLPLKNILLKYAGGKRGRAQRVRQCAREKRLPRDCTRTRRRQTTYVFQADLSHMVNHFLNLIQAIF